MNTSPLFALLNIEKIQFPLLLRRPKIGDYFYPLGMQKKKKINRFLSDQKLSKTQKENCWVIESNKKLLIIVQWALNYLLHHYECLNQPTFEMDNFTSRKSN